MVSIHAPVMDANDYPQGVTLSKSFNPRARDGREYLTIRVTIARRSFNPRARDGRELYSS